VISDGSEKIDPLMLEDGAVAEESQTLRFIPYCYKPTTSSKQNTTQQVKIHTYQVPTATCFGSKVPSSGSLSTTKFRRSNALTATSKVASLKQFKLRTAHQQHECSSSNTTQRPAATAARSQYFLSRAHKYPYQYLIQRHLLRRKLTKYPVPGYSVHCTTLHFTVYSSCLATRLSSCHITIQEREQNVLEEGT